MGRFLVRRLLGAIVTLFVVSIAVWILVELPPGDFAERYAATKLEGGVTISAQELEALRERFGLNDPLWFRYWHWISGIVFHGDWGLSLRYDAPVSHLIGDRLLLTVLIVVATLLVTYGLSIPIGIYAAVRRYSVTDYAFTTIGYIGLALPNFLLALVLLYVSVRHFGSSVGGLFSDQFKDAPWSIAKSIDLFKHLWVPIVVLGTANLALQLQTVRSRMLDEMNSLYVTAARARGVPEARLLFKYPVRQAMNPIVSTVSFDVNRVLSDAPVVALVLALPELGQLLINSLIDQDTLVAGAILMIMSVVYVVGNVLADIMLAVLDPRVRLAG